MAKSMSVLTVITRRSILLPTEVAHYLADLIDENGSEYTTMGRNLDDLGKVDETTEAEVED
jgi:hypothetical protein